jgi:N-sulfoglucosamine sulfohydrolase
MTKSILHLTSIFFAAFCAFGAEQGQSPRPNLLFILTEDQGAQIGCIGTPGLQTPHMDSLARTGLYFNNAFVVYPVCSASKASIYTGLHSHANGLLNNTVNYHKRADELTDEEREKPLNKINRVKDGLPTLVERLHDAGYYQGVTHKIHVAPNEKFPFDEFIKGNGKAVVAGFIERAGKAGKPWHLFYNVPNSHRPYPNSDNVKIRVNPDEVKLPAFLPDTPVVRKDWAEYLAAIEEADEWVGQGLAALRESGQETNTIVVFLGDHGPTFQHGKMTLYDLGLRTPLIIRVPGMSGGQRTEALVSAVDLTPTLLDLLGAPALPKSHGKSLKPVLKGQPGARGHEFVFAEISNRGALPNDGMQERSVFDGRWKLIYREKVETAWRQVNADSKVWKPWGNRTYAETVKFKDKFPEAFRILAEMDPQSLGGKVPVLELYDLRADPDEMRNLAKVPANRAELDRLYRALRQWVKDTADPAVQPPEMPPLPKAS